MPADACTGAVRKSFSRLLVLPDPATNRSLCFGIDAGTVTRTNSSRKPDEMAIRPKEQTHRRLRGDSDPDGSGGRRARSHRTVLVTMSRLQELALAIADHAVRSEIELYAMPVPADDGSSMYDTARPAIAESLSNEDWMQIVSDAIAYVGMRGDALPYIMHRQGNVVWFVERAR